MCQKTPNDYFSRHSGETAAILTQLRTLLRQIAPALNEHLAWGYPCYRGHERIVSLCAQRGAYVNIQLFRGAELSKRFPRIEGTGKSLRHVKIFHTEQINAEISDILKAAIALDADDPKKVS